MNEPDVAIIILNWNGLALTKSCLKSIAEQSYKNYRIIVIDNGSVDGSQAWLEKQEVILIKNRKNKGFARGINKGLKEALELNVKYAVALNNDVVLDKNWLKILVKFMEKNKHVGFAQGASMQFKDRKIYDSTGIYLERGFIPNQRASGKDSPQLDMPAIGPNAAGAIYRSTMLKSIRHSVNEYFDRMFFAYVEDVDFNLRCTVRGYEFAYVEEAIMYHVGSATGNKIARRKMFWGARNMVWLAYKNAPFTILRKTIRSIIKSHLANLQYLYKNQRKNFWPYFLGLTIGIIGIPLFMNKRFHNLHEMKITNDRFYELLVQSNPPLINPLRNLKKLLKYK